MFKMALMERVIFLRGRLGIILTGGGGGGVHSTSARMFSRTCRAAFDREEWDIFLNLRNLRRDRQFLRRFSPGRRNGHSGRMLSRGDRSSGAHISWEVLVNVDQVADNSLSSSLGGLGPATALGVNMV